MFMSLMAEIIDEFREKLYLSVDDLQTDLDKWLQYYNNERSHRGYRNMVRRPIETIEKGKQKRKDMKKKAA